MPEKVSVIVPHVADDAHLENMRGLLRAQTWENLETIFVEDAGRRGPSWARNRGLDRATGGIVLFADVDDEMAPDWVARMVAGLGSADLGWAGYTRVRGGRREAEPPSVTPHLLTGRAVAPALFRRVFGYRLRDLPKAILPGGLWKNCRREMAGVWRLAVRRRVLGGLRFDESLRLYEDAMFIAALARRARSLRVFGDAGYVWFIRETGSMCTENRERKTENKFALRDARRRIDPEMAWWRGTFVLSALEILKCAGPAAARRYVRGGKPS